MIKDDTVLSWLSEQGYNDLDCQTILDKMKRSEILEGNCWEILIRISPFTGYSGYYTQQVAESIETVVRHRLDNTIGYLNDKSERNYDITRQDWEGMKDDSSSD